jgi:RNA polymerase sigma-70 factor (ECF subfamily)
MVSGLGFHDGALFGRGNDAAQPLMDGSDPEPGATGGFPRTRWTIVVAAGKDSSADARAAVGQLYETYRLPLIYYLRGLRHSPEAAEEMVQAFFEFLLQKGGLSKVRRRGTFRSWLLASLKHFVFDQWDRERALKRGGGVVRASLGEPQEGGAVIDPADPGLTPDQEYDRQFALRFLQVVMDRLELEYAERGKSTLFQHLHEYLVDTRGDLNHAELGMKLGTTEGSVSQEICRMRGRFRGIFKAELRLLLSADQEYEAEKKLLLAALRRAAG